MAFAIRYPIHASSHGASVSCRLLRLISRGTGPTSSHHPRGDLVSALTHPADSAAEQTSSPPRLIPRGVSGETSSRSRSRQPRLLSRFRPGLRRLTISSSHREMPPRDSHAETISSRFIASHLTQSSPPHLFSSRNQRGRKIQTKVTQCQKGASHPRAEQNSSPPHLFSSHARSKSRLRLISSHLTRGANLLSTLTHVRSRSPLRFISHLTEQTSSPPISSHLTRSKPRLRLISSRLTEQTSSPLIQLIQLHTVEDRDAVGLL